MNASRRHFGSLVVLEGCVDCWVLIEAVHALREAFEAHVSDCRVVLDSGLAGSARGLPTT